ncbi:MAG TPA: hypothetical protein QF646_07280 [Candidatus Poseidoniales archaeon]|nr:hypothetical protein [Candidatus Poseidoniales archaeon]
MAHFRLLIFLVSIVLLCSLPTTIPEVHAAAGCTTPSDAEDAENVTTLIEDVFSESRADESIDSVSSSVSSSRSDDGEGPVAEEPFFENTFLSSRNSPLRPIEKGMSLRTSLGNDTANALRVNLTKGWRYTFCIEASSLDPVNASASFDAYLMTTNQFDDVYANEENYEDEFEEMVDNGFASFITWTPYRDVHAYENREQVQFSVALDKDPNSNVGLISTLGIPGMDGTSSLPSGVTPPNFVLVIDGRDNQRTTDAKPTGVDQLVDVVILSEEQFTLPPSTVVLACCFGVIVLAAVPFALHTRYHRTGRNSDSSAPVVGLVSEQDKSVDHSSEGE